MTQRESTFARGVLTDPSTWSLIAANALTIYFARALQMKLGDLMFIYWMQSVLIGLSFVTRILFLRHLPFFGTGDGYSEAGDGRVGLALFFVAHYGIFHLGYLLFMFIFPLPGLAAPEPDAGTWYCVAAFGATHAFSLAYNIARDSRGRPSATAVMALPYARIVPMHATMLAPAFTGSGMGPGAIWLFLWLKTLADVLMHVVEHRVLRGTSRQSQQ